jgi:hypothetical protein
MKEPNQFDDNVSENGFIIPFSSLRSKWIVKVSKRFYQNIMLMLLVTVIN